MDKDLVLLAEPSGPAPVSQSRTSIAKSAGVVAFPLRSSSEPGGFGLRQMEQADKRDWRKEASYRLRNMDEASGAPGQRIGTHAETPRTTRK